MPKEGQWSGGFTLVELLISVAIIGVVTSIVLIRYNVFDSTVLLKSLAYEIGLSLREAQVRSVSVARNDDSFDYPYGISFSLGKEYTSFRYTITDPSDPSFTEYPEYGVDTEDIRRFSIERTMRVTELCVETATIEECDDITRLDISFRRPKFTGLFYAEGFAGNSEDITSAKIKLGSATPNFIFVVEVTNLGQISVYQE